jgi:radical SAM protein with 4Fe4S-binding SPASM domain
LKKGPSSALRPGAGRFVAVTTIPKFGLFDPPRARRPLAYFNLDITARCNNDCGHCYINLPARDAAARARELAPAEILRIAREAADLGALWCALSGGEPLLREDFTEIYAGLKKLGLLVTIYTNACLVTPATIRLFKRYPPRDIEVTVYGISRRVYERVTRRPGSYAAFKRGLRLLEEAGLPVRLKAMALRSNFEEFEAIASFCREKTKDFYRFDPILHLRYDGNPARNALIRRERLSPAQIVALERADPARSRALQAMCAERRPPAPSGPGPSLGLLRCGTGTGGFDVGPAGEFRLCPSLWPADFVYDLRRGSVADAWNRFVPEALAKAAKSRGGPAECRTCPIADLCLWCPAHAHLETGRTRGKTIYFCRVAHARAKAFDAPGIRASGGPIAPRRP